MRVLVVEKVDENSRQKDKFDVNDMLTKAQGLLSACKDFSNYSSGDDILAVAGKALKKQIGNDSIYDNQAGRERLLEILVIGFHKEHFENTKMYNVLKNWQFKTGYTILN